MKRIQRLNPEINAYLLITEEEALRQAQYIDEHLDSLRDSPLLGIPVSIKDLLLDMQGIVTSNGSLLCRDMIAARDSLSVQRLREARAIFLGKTNVPEFGSGYITQNKLIPPTRNPWKLTHTAGGSSGGSAASVIAGMASCALANDSAGSIRLPSAFCSLFGYMPAAGRVPCTSLQELHLKPLQRIGPITRTVTDAALLLDVICTPVPNDPDQKSSISFESLLHQEQKQLTLGWLPNLSSGLQDPEITEIIRKKLISLERMGHRIEEISLPIDLSEHIEIMTHYILARFSLLAEKIPLPAGALLGPSIRKMIKKSTSISCCDFLKASTFRETFRQSMHLFMQKYDLLLTPCTPVPAFDIESYPRCLKKQSLDPHTFFASGLYPFNLSGQPAASLPCGLNRDNLPVGLQVIGPENDDAILFQFCSFFERVFPWSDLYPKSL